MSNGATVEPGGQRPRRAQRRRRVALLVAAIVAAQAQSSLAEEIDLDALPAEPEAALEETTEPRRRTVDSRRERLERRKAERQARLQARRARLARARTRRLARAHERRAARAEAHARRLARLHRVVDSAVIAPADQPAAPPPRGARNAALQSASLAPRSETIDLDAELRVATREQSLESRTTSLGALLRRTPSPRTSNGVRDHGAEDSPRAPEVEHFRHVVAVRAGYVEAGSRVQQGPTAPASLNYKRALGVAFERAIIPGVLNAELAASIMASTEGVNVPTQLLIKIPFQLGNNGELFIGGGAVMEVHEAKANEGLIATTGYYYWPTAHLGLSMAADYAMSVQGEVQYELGLMAGIATRF
jgi:hypothetical protein